MEPFKLTHPSTVLIAGPTGSGKTYFLRELLKHRNEMFREPRPKRVIWFYGEYQTLFEDMEDYVEFREGSNFESVEEDSLVILDDLMNELSGEKKLANLFTKYSHHRKLTVIFIVQNVFHQGREMRNVSLNAQYMFLFKNRRDVSQVTHLGRQLFPNKIKFFNEVFEDSTKKPYSYLMVDLRPETEEEMRLRTNVLPGQTQYIYKPRK